MGNLFSNNKTARRQTVDAVIWQDQENQRRLEEAAKIRWQVQRLEEDRQRQRQLEEYRQQVEVQENQGRLEEAAKIRWQVQRLKEYRQQQRQLEEYRQQVEVQRKRREQVEAPRQQFLNSISAGSSRSRSFPAISNILEGQFEVSAWNGLNSSQVVMYVELYPTSPEYQNINRKFRNTNKRFFKVSRIERVENPYLLGMYLLKKEELSNRHGSTKEELLFHGTKEKHIENICRENFNWRMHGKGTGHRFGKGVSFTPISNYATHYCDKYSSIKIMLLVKVLVSNPCIGNPQMVVPPNGFDTSKKENGHVIVKYYDDEFYPAYKIYFHKLGSDI